MRLLGVGVVIWVFVSVATARGAPPTPSPDKPLVIIGRVHATTKASPSCGEFAFAMKVRVQVERVLEGDYRHDFLDMTVGCPELFPVKLGVGARAKLRLQRTPPKPATHWVIAGDLPKPQRPAFWLVTGEPVGK